MSWRGMNSVAHHAIAYAMHETFPHLPSRACLKAVWRPQLGFYSTTTKRTISNIQGSAEAEARRVVENKNAPGVRAHCLSKRFFEVYNEVETELPTEKNDANPVVPKVAEAMRVGFDALNFRVQSFGHRVGDVMLPISQQIFRVALEHLGHFHQRLEPPPAHPAKPILEKPPRPAFFLIVPEPFKWFLGRPSLRHFQMQIFQRQISTFVPD